MTLADEVQALRQAAFNKLMDNRPEPEFTVIKGKVRCTCQWERCEWHDMIRFKWRRLGRPIKVGDLVCEDFERDN